MKNRKVTLEVSCQIRAAYQVGGLRGNALLKRFPQWSKAGIYKHTKKPIDGEPVFDKRKLNKGRPKKLSDQDRRSIVRSVKVLRKECGTFTSARVQIESGVGTKVHNKTVRRCMNDAGLFYLQSRKKGLLYKKDLIEREKFCKNIRKKKLGQEFWNTGISFYLDGKGFEYKKNPQDQARAPTAREWRKKGEGLNFGCVAKGKKEGATNANFMVAISYGKGVVLCKRYEGSITGEKFSAIVRAKFPDAFERSSNPRAKRLLMDGCPRQNSKVALKAIHGVQGIVFGIPSRSPDLNPIENFFHLCVKKLKKDANEKNITSETFKQFCRRVKQTLFNFPVEKIDDIISSMDKRVGLIIKSKGQRIKY